MTQSAEQIRLMEEEITYKKNNFPRCKAITRANVQCHNRATVGDFCYIHSLKNLSEKVDEKRNLETDKRNKESNPALENMALSRVIADEEFQKGLVEKLDKKMVQVLQEKIEAYIEKRVNDILSNIEGATYPHSRKELEDLSEFWSSIIELLKIVAGILNMKTIERLFTAGIAQLLDLIKDVSRRMRGEFEVDEFGLDKEYQEIWLPFFRFLFEYYFRCEVQGGENIPEKGGSLILANRSGWIPWDAMMLKMAVRYRTKGERELRVLMSEYLFKLPFISPFLIKTGQLLACPENAAILLEKGHLVGVFPEGVKGGGKLFKDRYIMQRFVGSGYVLEAIKAHSPIIPTAIVGAEETYPMLGRIGWLGKLFGLPYFPITPTFPWAPLPFSLIPLPTKWYIAFGEPYPTDNYDISVANNLSLVVSLEEEIREIIQNQIIALLRKRSSIF